jgi:hypothetical protein
VCVEKFRHFLMAGSHNGLVPRPLPIEGAKENLPDFGGGAQKTQEKEFEVQLFGL